MVYKKLDKEELTAVIILLRGADLPYEDISEHSQNFIVAKENNKIVAAVGIEIYGDKGLLRSLVVDPSIRNKGIGSELYYRCLTLAKEHGIKELALLTTTAERFFANHGFEKISRESIPEYIKNTKEFSLYCPSSSTIMIKRL